MENNTNNMPESIWADGCPENVREEEKIKQEELHAMAIEYIVKNCLIPKGFEIFNGFPRREFPNVVCKKDDTTYAIVVVPSVYPDFVAINDQFRLQVVELCKKNGAIGLYASVGYKSIDEERAKARMMLRGDVFYTSFPGFHILTDEPTQNFQVPYEQLFRP